jgi:hypothetical protein
MEGATSRCLNALIHSYQLLILHNPCSFEGITFMAVFVIISLAAFFYPNDRQMFNN